MVWHLLGGGADPAGKQDLSTGKRLFPVVGSGECLKQGQSILDVSISRPLLGANAIEKHNVGT